MGAEETFKLHFQIAGKGMSLREDALTRSESLLARAQTTQWARFGIVGYDPWVLLDPLIRLDTRRN